MCLEEVSNYIFSYRVYLIPQDFMLLLCWQMNKDEIYRIWASVKTHSVSKVIVLAQLFPLSYWLKTQFYYSSGLITELLSSCSSLSPSITFLEKPRECSRNITWHHDLMRWPWQLSFNTQSCVLARFSYFHVPVFQNILVAYYQIKGKMLHFAAMLHYL